MSEQQSFVQSTIGKLRHFYSMHFYTYHALYLKPGPPIIVYSMTKSGSSSLHESIKQYITALKAHTLDPERATRQLAERRAENYWNPGMEVLDRRGRQLYHQVAKPRRFAKYITLVRNPIERDISRFFQKFDRLVPLDAQGNLTLTTDEMIDFALDKIEHDEQVGRDWFDDEYKNILGIDVYEHPFPHDTGVQRLEYDHADVLLMKLETPDEAKVQAVRDFLDLPNFDLERTNIASEKDFADVYKAIKKRIVLPESFINQALDSKLTHHFYTPEEIEASRQKWMTRVEQAQTV